MNVFTVVYPELYKKTGKAICQSGHFQVFYKEEHGIIPVIADSPIDPNEKSPPTGKVSILDPRVIVFNESTAKVDYSPRYYEEYQAAWVRTWLREHANWGMPGCESDWNKAVRRTGNLKGRSSETQKNATALSRNNRKPIPPRLRFDVMKRDGFRCQYCGATAQETRLEVDHIIPVSKGGTDDQGNLITACVDCNRGKSDSDVIAA